MFEDLYDAISKLWSWRWPVAEGKVTEVLVERLRHANSHNDSFRLSVTYEFSVGADGPYTGEGFWKPTCSVKRVPPAGRKIRNGQRVQVRYRPDEPGVNVLDGGVSRLLKRCTRGAPPRTRD